MKYLLFVLLFCGIAKADDLVYEGEWVTNKGRNLDGTMTCVVKDLGKNRWSGKFYGIWQGQRFSYTVSWEGRPDKLKGKATIDGADYDWEGEFGAQSPGWFKGTFVSRRYSGYFNLKEKK